MSQPVAGVGAKGTMLGPAAGPMVSVQQASAGGNVSNNQSGRLAEPAQAGPLGPMAAAAVPQVARTPQSTISGGKHAAVPVQHSVQGAFVRTKPSQAAVSAATKRSASTAVPGTAAGLPVHPTQPPLKKPRANPKLLKKSTVGGKASVENSTKVEPVVGQKGALPSVPSAITQPISGRPSANGQIQMPGVSSAVDVPKKASRKVDDDLDIVGGIVDIEGEEDMLVAEGGIATRNVGPTDYDSAMLLDGEALRRKIGTVTSRLGLGRDVSTETMEIISLAARERLLHMLEEAHEIAIARTDSGLSGWRVSPSGPNIFERMQQQRDQEERSLLAQVAVRSEKAAKAAAKAAESTADAEKSAKEAAATADAKKKEQARQEKDKLADVTQKSALAKLVGSLVIRKSKPKGTSSGGASSIAKGSSSAPGRTSLAGNVGQVSGPAMSAGPSRTQSGNSDRKKARDAAAVTSTVIIDLEAGDEITVDPAPNNSSALDDRTVMNGMTSSRAASIAVPRRISRPAITLSDCIHFMEREPRSRKSNLLYFWYPRLGTKNSSALALPKK
jgi:Transcription initiation factor TFIID component TAF4 family